MVKILSNSYSALGPPQTYGRVDFNYLTQTLQASELSKKIKDTFYLLRYCHHDGTRTITTRTDTGLIIFGHKVDPDKASKANAGDEKIFLEPDAVKFIEEKWLNGYHFPSELYENFYDRSLDGTVLSTIPGFIRLDKLIDHLQNLTGPAHDALNRFLEIKAKS